MNLKAFSAFFKQFYERVIAVTVMMLLVIFSLWLVLRVNNLENDIKQEEGIGRRGAGVAPADFTGIDKSLARCDNPSAWTTNTTDHRLFIAPLMKVIPPKPTPDFWNPKVIDWGYSREGIEIKWLRKNGLSVTEPVANLDLDGDGFTTWEEYKADTDPNDPNSKPDLSTKLRVVRVIPNIFAFIFNGVQETPSGTVFSLLRLDGRKNYFLKLNEEIPDEQYKGYKLIKFEKKKVKQEDPTIKDDNGNPLVKEVDVSELTVQREGGQPILMVKGVKAKTEEFSAQLYFILSKKSFEIREGQTFLLQDVQYQVISIKMLDGGQPEVIIKHTDPEKEDKLLKLLQFRKEDTETSSTTTQPRTNLPKGTPTNPNAPASQPGFPSSTVPTPQPGFPTTPPPPQR